MSEKVKVQLAKPFSWSGTDYASGMQEIPESGAQYAERRGFGKIVKSDGHSSGTVEFTPLTVEETIQRFADGDWTDEVMKSMQTHKEAMLEIRHQSLQTEKADAQTETETKKENFAPDDAKNSGENATDDGAGKTSEDDSELPKDFPQRHIFAKLGFTSVSEVQGLTLEQLIALDGIAEATAGKALAYGKNN